MSFLNRMSRALERSFVNAGRTQARQHLLARGERFLADNGLSRELLERGNGAWPWRVDDAGSAAARPLSAEGLRAAMSPRREHELPFERAAAELHALSDADLADLGIAREGIADAVRFGRPGIERPADDTADRIAA